MAFFKKLEQHLSRMTLVWHRSQIHGRSRVVKELLTDLSQIDAFWGHSFD